MSDGSRDLMEQALARARAQGWEAGFYAGELYGAAREKHDPQWDWGDAPQRPENPYLLGRQPGA